uniref:Putative nuclease n=1 Tax=viral metagenome TaxID=1070528 RepID=A0A6M3K154_9ZZZZ
MIYLDDRVGAKELFPYFGVGSCKIQRLSYGDVMFTGNGPEGVTYRIGIERKVVRDLISSMANGRLVGHQLAGMKNSYNVVYVLVEGAFRPAQDSGLVEMYSRHCWHVADFGESRRRFMYRDIVAFLNTLGICGGVTVLRAGTRVETAAIVSALHYWWTNKEFEEHHGHMKEFVPEVVLPLGKVSTVRRVAMTLPGIGWELSSRVADKFENVLQMVSAPVEEWETIPGIGNGIATKAVRELRGLE